MDYDTKSIIYMMFGSFMFGCGFTLIITGGWLEYNGCNKFVDYNEYEK